MTKCKSIESLFLKPLWQLSCDEFCELIRYAISGNYETPDSHVSHAIRYAYGMHDLALQVGCCDATIYNFKRLGVLDEAIVSQIGKKIVFDVDKARILADNYQKDKRALIKL